MSSHSDTRGVCSRETRDEYLRPLKRAGETYDELFRAMAEQYDPEERER
jgi:hypothetical protein